MEFKQASSILISNFSLVFKLFLYILVVTLIVAAITVGIISPVLKLVMSDEVIPDFISQSVEVIKDFLQQKTGLQEAIDKLIEKVSFLLNYLMSTGWYLIAILLIIIFAYFLYLFLFTLSSVPIADIMNNSMSSNMKYGFMSNFALNFRKSVKYSSLKILIFFPYDVATTAILCGIAYGFFQTRIALVQYFSLVIVLVLGIVFAAARQTFFSGWIPRLIFHPYEGVVSSLNESFPAVKQNWKALFMSYCCVYFCLYFLVTVGGLFTFGLMSILAPSMSYIILRVIELVSYYKTNKLRFYVDSMHVVNTVEYGMREEEEKSSVEQIALRNRRLNEKIREISYEPTKKEILDNPTFYEALKLGLSGERVSYNTLQIRFGISKTIAKAIIKTMEDMNFLESKSKIGTKKVIITQEQYDELLFGNLDDNKDKKQKSEKEGNNK